METAAGQGEPPDLAARVRQEQVSVQDRDHALRDKTTGPAGLVRRVQADRDNVPLAPVVILEGLIAPAALPEPIARADPTDLAVHIALEEITVDSVADPHEENHPGGEEVKGKLTSHRMMTTTTMGPRMQSSSKV